MAKLDKHKKYENEIDLLLNEDGKTEVQPDDAAAEASEEEQSDFEEE